MIALDQLIAMRRAGRLRPTQRVRDAIERALFAANDALEREQWARDEADYQERQRYLPYNWQERWRAHWAERATATEDGRNA